MKHYCEACPQCLGYGGIEVDTVTYHPYSSGYARETLTEHIACSECDGTGMEFVAERALQVGDVRVDVITRTGLRGTYYFSDEDLAATFARNEIYEPGVLEVQVFEIENCAAVFQRANRKVINQEAIWWAEIN